MELINPNKILRKPKRPKVRYWIGIDWALGKDQSVMWAWDAKKKKYIYIKPRD